MKKTCKKKTGKRKNRKKSDGQVVMTEDVDKNERVNAGMSSEL